MVGLVLALAAAACWGASDYFAGLTTQRASVWRVLVVCMVTGMALSVPVAVARAVVGEWPAAGDWGPLLRWSVVSGLAEAGGYAALYAAMARGPLGVASSLAGAGVALPVLVGLLGGTGLDGWQAAGLAVAALGIAALSWTGRAQVDTRCLLAGALAAGFFGLSTVALASAAAVDEWSGVALMRVSTVVVLLPVALLLRTRSRTRQDAAGEAVIPAPATAAVGVVPAMAPVAGTVRRVARHSAVPTPDTARRSARHRRPEPTWLGLAIMVGVLDIAGCGAFAEASTRASLAAVALLGALYPLITALMARVWMAERLPGRMRWGACAAVLGSALLVL